MGVCALQQHLRDGPSQTGKHGGSHDQYKPNQVELRLASYKHDQACADDSNDHSKIPAWPATLKLASMSALGKQPACEQSPMTSIHEHGC